MASNHTVLFCILCFFSTNIDLLRTMYQRKVDVDMLNAVKSVLADVSSVSPSSEQSDPISWPSCYIVVVLCLVSSLCRDIGLSCFVCLFV